MSQRIKNFFSYHINTNLPIRIVSLLLAAFGTLGIVVGFILIVWSIFTGFSFIGLIAVPIIIIGIVNIILSYGLSRLRKWVIYLFGIITVSLFLIGNPYFIVNLLFFIIVLVYRKRFEGNVIPHVIKKFILIVITLIIIAVVGFFAWQYSFFIKDTIFYKINNWQSYKSETLNFELKYPQQFAIKEDNGKVLLSEIKYANNLKLSFEKSNKSFNELLSKFDVEDVVIGNRESKFLFLGENNQVNKNYYIYIDDSSTFIIKATVTEYGVMSFEEQSALLDKILSTFKFSGEQKIVETKLLKSIDTTGWIDYRSNKYNFELKYPKWFSVKGEDRIIFIDEMELDSLSFFFEERNGSIKDMTRNLDLEDVLIGGVESKLFVRGDANIYYIPIHNTTTLVIFGIV